MKNVNNETQKQKKTREEIKSLPTEYLEFQPITKQCRWKNETKLCPTFGQNYDRQKKNDCSPIGNLRVACVQFSSLSWQAKL